MRDESLSAKLANLNAAVEAKREGKRTAARAAFERMPASHQDFLRAVAEAFGRPDAVRLEVDGEVIHESGEFGAPGPQHEARVRESVKRAVAWDFERGIRKAER